MGNLTGLEQTTVLQVIENGSEIRPLIDLRFRTLIRSQVAAALKFSSPFYAFRTIATATPMRIVVGIEAKALDYRSDPRKVNNNKRKKEG